MDEVLFLYLVNQLTNALQNGMWSTDIVIPKEEYFYREIYEKFFPSPTAALCPPHEAGVACSTAKALEWDEAWKSSNEPSGRAISGVHDQAY